MPDEYSEKINQYWDEITRMYIIFEDKKPIIELEPNRPRIIAFPAEGKRQRKYTCGYARDALINSGSIF